jgi:hypothetical protein
MNVADDLNATFGKSELGLQQGDLRHDGGGRWKLSGENALQISVIKHDSSRIDNEEFGDLVLACSMAKAPPCFLLEVEHFNGGDAIINGVH